MSLSKSISGITVSLSDKELWEKFHPNTEMVVTKSRGRKLFPDMSFKIKGLVPDALYSVYIYMERCDSLKYKFDAGKWSEAAKGEPFLPINKKQHEDGGQTGKHWMSKPVSFHHIRITNNPESKNRNDILLQSMHKYQPVVMIKRLDNGEEEEFRLKTTEFMAVTAYQNIAMVELKTSLNKFASGFRPSGKHNQKSPDAQQRGTKRQSTSPPVYPPTQPMAPIPSWNSRDFNNQIMPPSTAPPVFDFNNNGSANQYFWDPYGMWNMNLMCQNTMNQFPTFSMNGQNNMPDFSGFQVDDQLNAANNNFNFHQL